MDNWLANVQDALAAMTAIELIAVVAGVVYLVLAGKESLWCWLFAAVSTLLYIYILWDVKLYAEMALQFYYLFMAGYGFYQWKFSHSQNENQMPISVLSIKQHGLLILSTLIPSAVLGYILASQTDAQLPYVDSFTTVGALVTTWMVTKKYLENWLYWIVVDGVAVYQYFNKELYLTALLFVAYVIMVIIGYFAWRKDYHQQLAAN